MNISKFNIHCGQVYRCDKSVGNELTKGWLYVNVAQWTYVDNHVMLINNHGNTTMYGTTHLTLVLEP